VRLRRLPRGAPGGYRHAARGRHLPRDRHHQPRRQGRAGTLAPCLGLEEDRRRHPVRSVGDPARARLPRPHPRPVAVAPHPLPQVPAREDQRGVRGLGVAQQGDHRDHPRRPHAIKRSHRGVCPRIRGRDPPGVAIDKTSRSRHSFKCLLGAHRTMTSPVRLSRTLSLRAAASVVFALVALLPILLLVYFLSWADFLRLVSQIARLAETVQASAAGKPVVLRDESSAVVPRLAEVTEIGQLTAAFRQMVDDLRGATQRLEDLVFKLGTLNETVELAARVPRMQDLLTLVLQNTMRAVRATRGSIMMLDPERQVLKVVVGQDIPADIVSRVEVKLGEGIAGKVDAEGEPSLVEEIETDPRFGRQSAPQYGSGAFICMPIRVANRIIGVINLAKKKPEAGAASLAPFSPIDLQFLNALLTYVGYSVENARLLQEARQSAQRLHGVVEDLKTTQAQLVRGETLRAIGQLASGMAHHLNNLFAVIVGRAELALR